MGRHKVESGEQFAQSSTVFIGIEQRLGESAESEFKAGERAVLTLDGMTVASKPAGEGRIEPIYGLASNDGIDLKMFEKRPKVGPLPRLKGARVQGNPMAAIINIDGFELATQLRAALGALGQIQTGLKATLVERLVDAQRAASVPVRKSNVTSPSTPSTRRSLDGVVASHP